MVINGEPPPRWLLGRVNLHSGFDWPPRPRIKKTLMGLEGGPKAHEARSTLGEVMVGGVV